MKIKEIRKMDEKKLHERLTEVRGKLLSTRFGVAGGQIKNVRELRSLKRQTARLLTVGRERETSKAKDSTPR